MTAACTPVAAPRIIDCTLREGTQAPGVRLTPTQSKEIAAALAEIGVDMIECGHPSQSERELRRVQAVTGLRLPAPVLAHARAHRGDVEAVARSGAQWAGIFLGVNEISRRARLVGKEVHDLLAMIERSVSYAVRLGLQVRYSVEDGSRTDPALLREAFAVALAAGAHRLGFTDTVGSLEPKQVQETLGCLRASFPGVPLEVHFHDDRGLALANALAAVDAGVDWISAAVNGLGERCGVTDLVVLLANLHYRGNRPLARGPEVKRLSQRVSAYARSPQDARRPVVGMHAFQHTARLHRLAVRRDPSAYSALEPELFGSGAEEVLGRLPDDPESWIVRPDVVSATELLYHRAGPGDRYVLLNDRLVPHARQYCIVRRIPRLRRYGPGHVDVHAHGCDSLFVFLGEEAGYRGLDIEVMLEGRHFLLSSPVSVFIPAGIPHSYRVLGGSGTFFNHVLAGDYNSSLLGPTP